MATSPNAPPIKFPLSRPITWAGQEIRELELKRPTAAQLWEFPLPTVKGATMELGSLLRVAAKCSGLPDEALRMIDGADALELASIVGELLASSRQTGT